MRGVDLATADDATIAAVRQALTDHKVLFFPGQQLDPDSQVALGNRMGRLTVSHPVVPGLDEAHAEIYALDSADNGFADMWHTDVTFVKRPPLGSILRAVTLPPHGGDTNWADLELAFASLSEPVQRLAEQLTAVHDGTREFGYYLAQRRQGEGSLWEGERFTRLEPIEHPVVRVHPETGRRSLFVNPGFVEPHRRGVRRREPPPARPVLRPHHQARAHRAAPLAGRRRRDVGQPGHRALRQPRLRHRPQGHAPHHPAW